MIKVEFTEKQLIVLDSVLQVYVDEILEQQEDFWTLEEKRSFISIKAKVMKIVNERNLV